MRGNDNTVHIKNSEDRYNNAVGSLISNIHYILSKSLHIKKIK